MVKRKQVWINGEDIAKLDAMVAPVQEHYPAMNVTRATVVRLVLQRGMDELTRDVQAWERS